MPVVDHLLERKPQRRYTYMSPLCIRSFLFLRIYEGCARTLTGYLEGANIVKLHRDKPAVSYLWYPNFDDDGHPSLSGAFIVYLDSLQVHYRDYSQLENPPILHRKEEFVLELTRIGTSSRN